VTELPQDAKSYTIAEFAALCREKCNTPAQGYDDESVACGEEHLNDEGETVTSFCGRHWRTVFNAMGDYG
jgi:hypothetical protein